MNIVTVRFCGHNTVFGKMTEDSAKVLIRETARNNNGRSYVQYWIDRG